MVPVCKDGARKAILANTADGIWDQFGEPVLSEILGLDDSGKSPTTLSGSGMPDADPCAGGGAVSSFPSRSHITNLHLCQLSRRESERVGRSSERHWEGDISYDGA